MLHDAKRRLKCGHVIVHSLVNETRLLEDELDELFFLKESLDHRWRLLVAPDDSAHGQFLVLRNVARQAGYAQGVHGEGEIIPCLGGVRDSLRGASRPDRHEKRGIAQLWEIHFGLLEGRTAGAVEDERLETSHRRDVSSADRFAFEGEAVTLDRHLQLRQRLPVGEHSRHVGQAARFLDEPPEIRLGPLVQRRLDRRTNHQSALIIIHQSSESEMNDPSPYPSRWSGTGRSMARRMRK